MDIVQVDLGTILNNVSREKFNTSSTSRVEHKPIGLSKDLLETKTRMWNLTRTPPEKQFFNNFNINFLMHNMQILPLKLYFVHSKIPKTPRGETPEIKVDVLTWTTNKPHFVNLENTEIFFPKGRSK